MGHTHAARHVETVGSAVYLNTADCEAEFRASHALRLYPDASAEALDNEMFTISLRRRAIMVGAASWLAW
jgi:hypothetical protein